jgi:hypothetical protein
MEGFNGTGSGRIPLRLSGSKLDDLVAEVKAVAQSSHAELFAKIVDGFYE